MENYHELRDILNWKNKQKHLDYFLEGYIV